jgi:archaemetzincin
MRLIPGKHRVTNGSRKTSAKPLKKGIIAVVPLGKVAEDVMRVVADSLQGILRLPVDLLDATPIPNHTFMESRNQHNAMAIIKYLDKSFPHNSLKILGVTERDLSNPILTYVFGEAYMGGRSAVLSTARLKVAQTGETVSRELFLERVVKVALHELGHTFNLPHCHTDRCVMRASNGLMDLDEKLNYVCSYCELLLFEAVSNLLQQPRHE